jgi:hypothetical protein
MIKDDRVAAKLQSLINASCRYEETIQIRHCIQSVYNELVILLSMKHNNIFYFHHPCKKGVNCFAFQIFIYICYDFLGFKLKNIIN